MQNNKTLQNLEILREIDKILVYVYENEENLTDEMIQIELLKVRGGIKNINCLGNKMLQSNKI